MEGLKGISKDLSIKQAEAIVEAFDESSDNEEEEEDKKSEEKAGTVTVLIIALLCLGFTCKIT